MSNTRLPSKANKAAVLAATKVLPTSAVGPTKASFKALLLFAGSAKVARKARILSKAGFEECLSVSSVLTDRRRKQAHQLRCSLASGTPVVFNWVKSCKAQSEEHTSELQSRGHLVCRLLLEKKNY